jgi:DNA-binding ferritin-like protein
MFNFVRQYLAYRDGMKGAKYFEKHPHLQERLEIIEEWCEELEERIVNLEEINK